MEIERKFLVRVASFGNSHTSLPGDWDTKGIEQFYTEVSKLSEVRFRKTHTLVGEKFYKTIKKGNGLVREEIETEISSEEYYKNRPDAVGSVITKVRKVNEEGWEIDFFKSPVLPQGVAILEKEFATVEESKSYTLPYGVTLIKELTEDKRFKNKNLCLNGFPEEVFDL